MTKQEKVEVLRSNPEIHYNCAQTVLIPYAEECGLKEETAYKLGANFGGGMRMGSVCGAVTGALMVLGLLGYDEEESKRMLKEFREKYGSVNCVELLRNAHEQGVERRNHCRQMMDECIAFLESVIEK